MRKEAQTTPNSRLKAQRLKKHWSQVYVATMIGTNDVTVSRWENGVTCPSLYYQQKLCELFGTGPEELGLLPDVQATGHTPNTSSVIWNVPSCRNVFFTGREEILTHLHALLSSEHGTALALAISGLGGIGKTQVALEYAYRHRDDYTAVLWIRAETSETLTSDCAALASLFHLPEQHEHDRSRTIEAIKRWLKTHSHWLLILDNVEDVCLLSDFLAIDTGCKLLTTRSQATGTFAQCLHLEQMGPEEGALFLLRRTKLLEPGAPLEKACPTEQDSARAISQLLDGLPLALDQAGAYIEETGCSLSDYGERYQRQRATLLKRRGCPVTDHPASVSTTLSLSFAKVEQSNPAAADLLRLCAFLAPDAIPEELIVEGVHELGSTFEPFADDMVALDDALAALRCYSLIHRHADTKTFTIHRLVQAVLRDRMDENTQRLWAERTVRVVNRVFPDGEEAALWPCCQRCLPHVEACTILIEQWGIVSAEAGRLLQEAGAYLLERAQYARAEQLLRKAVDIRTQALGAEHPLTAESLNDLGILYFDQGRYAQAEPLLQQSLAIRKQQLGTRHPDTANSLTNLALVYWEQGRYDEAEPLYQQAMSIWEQQPAPQDCSIAYTLHGLALLYYDQGRYDEAEPLYKRAMAVWEQQPTPQPRAIAFCLSNLARIYREQGRYSEAEPLFLRALALREQHMGPMHPHTGHSLNNLAKMYTYQGRYAEAEPLLLRALAIHEQQLRPDHPYMAFNLNYLGVLYQKQGKYAEAEPLLQRALAIRQQQLGNQHPYTAQSLHDLAVLYLEQGQHQEAQFLLQQALTIRENMLVPDHPAIAITLTHLARCHTQQGQYEQAESLFERALAIFEMRQPPHPQFATLLEHYANLLWKTQREVDAIVLEARAREMRTGQAKERLTCEEKEACSQPSLEDGSRRGGRGADAGGGPLWPPAAGASLFI